jgi:hypothetical protein
MPASNISSMYLHASFNIPHPLMCTCQNNYNNNFLKNNKILSALAIVDYRASRLTLAIFNDHI